MIVQGEQIELATRLKCREPEIARGYSGEPSPRSELNANVLSRGWLTVMATRWQCHRPIGPVSRQWTRYN